MKPKLKIQIKCQLKTEFVRRAQPIGSEQFSLEEKLFLTNRNEVILSPKYEAIEIVLNKDKTDLFTSTIVSFILCFFFGGGGVGGRNCPKCKHSLYF